jgi:hypothetical protein
MKLLDALVEQRIAAAAARGEFEDLPGTGTPQLLDEDARVPEEVRVANQILKNAGFMPPAIEQLRALCDLQTELSAARACWRSTWRSNRCAAVRWFCRASTAGVLPSGNRSGWANSIWQTWVCGE